MFAAHGLSQTDMIALSGKGRLPHALNHGVTKFRIEYTKLN